MQICNRNKGITLVALIITIIVLLILAGVSIGFLIGDNGVINKSQSAVNEYEEASKKEQDLLDQIDKYLENELGGGSAGDDTQTVPSVYENGLATENTTIVAKDDPSVQIVIPGGFAPAILQTGTTQSLPGENGAVKEIMPAEEWNNITKDDINKGIVVVDNTITYTDDVPDFNEYVWIPMPDINKFKRVAWNGPYWNGSNQNGIHPLAKVSTENAYWEEIDSAEYENMVNSVSSNKGFYISRYEASQKDSTTAQSKRGQQPWNSVSYIPAATASSNMKKSINSHLIYGIEWDSVLQWLLDSGATIGAETGGTKSIELKDIQSDSSSLGNYRNSIGDATTNSGNSVKPGGTNEYWKVNNIYDLAGNVWEWTQERYSTGTSRAGRGGGCYGDGNYRPSASRNIGDESYTDGNVRLQSRLLFVVLYFFVNGIIIIKNTFFRFKNV